MMSAPPATLPAPAAPRPLPAHLTPLIGREAEAAELRELLRSTRLLTLTGAGGSGKTRLALEVAARAAAEGIAVAWVELAPLGSADLLAAQVGGALGLPPAEDPVAALLAALAERPRLVVLDNCEHLVDACAVLAERLLIGSPALALLATSREPLGVPGERAWLVPLLAVPHEHAARPEEVAGSTAVRLFVERAREAVAGFQLTAENAGAVAEICRRLDGLPLALELAASWVRVLTPQQVAARLGEAFRLPSGGRRTAVPRQQTLRAAMDWSYGLLPPAHRRLLQRFAVFAGGFTVETAEQVCGGGEVAAAGVLDGLSALVDRSLVVMEEHDGVARYRLLEMVRQYAAERLAEAGEDAELRRRHVDHFLELAEALAPASASLDPPRLRRLARERDNLRAALQFALQDGQGELAARLALPLWTYWSTQGNLSEAAHWLDRVRADPGLSEATLSRVLFATATAAGMRADWATAGPLLERCLEIERRRGNRLAQLRILTRLCSVAVGRDEFEPGAALIQEAWALAEELGDRDRMAEVLNGWGRLEQARGALDAAARHYEHGIRLTRETGASTLGVPLSNLGIVHLDRGDLAAARPLLEESLAFSRAQGRSRNGVYPLSSLGVLAVAEGDLEGAIPLLSAAEALFAHHGSHLHPRDRPRYDAAMERARSGVSPEVWAREWARGQGLSLEEAAARALREAPPAPGVPAAAVVALPDAPRPEEEPWVRIQALGGLRISREGRAMSAEDWGSLRPRELLLYLLCHPQGRTRDQIGLVFWPESTAAQVKNAFHVTLHRLRRALDRPEVVMLEEERYRVNPDAAIDLDATRFEREVTLGLRELRAGGDGARVAAALALYQGDFLEGESVGDWHLEVHDRLRRLYVDGLAALAGWQMERGDLAGASDTLERLVRREDLDEAAHRALMTCLARSGRRDRALRHHERLAAHLRAELEAEPEDETLELVRRIQAGEPV